jgi:hypothetical protein
VRVGRREHVSSARFLASFSSLILNFVSFSMVSFSLQSLSFSARCSFSVFYVINAWILIALMKSVTKSSFVSKSNVVLNSFLLNSANVLIISRGMDRPLSFSCS